MSAIFPRRCTILGKKELLYLGPFGLSLWLAGVLFVDRKKGGDISISEIANNLTKNKVNKILYYITFTLYINIFWYTLYVYDYIKHALYASSYFYNGYIYFLSEYCPLII